MTEKTMVHYSQSHLIIKIKIQLHNKNKREIYDKTTLFKSQPN